MSRTLGTLLALILPSRGRHCGSARFSRRRRSTRVRRYVANPDPATAPRHTPAPSQSQSRPHPAEPRLAEPRLAEPRLAEPRQVLSADDVALVRPYYEAHEKHVARMRAAFQADTQPKQEPQPSRPPQLPQAPQEPPVPQLPRLPEPRIPVGDLLAGETAPLPEPKPEPAPVTAPVPVPVPVPAPARGRHHRVDEAELDRELARLTRMWHIQRQNLQMGVPA
ncbi:hypothetical protein [Nocardiopsis algeriensis]|uniref:Uncharacterized protein n=1 Tax=Nocardiopsis algeriensis TaxID=1478215 RepID=A0A841IIA6_9ACTN|nr:hypothetical protein [Nocardiopsis algeriensis]